MADGTATAALIHRLKPLQAWKGEVMLRVVVRSGKDASAVKAMLERFYRGW